MVFQGRQYKGLEGALGEPVKFLKGGHIIGGDSGEQGFIEIKLIWFVTVCVFRYHHTQK